MVHGFIPHSRLVWVAVLVDPADGGGSAVPAGRPCRPRSQTVAEPPLPAVDGNGGQDDEAVNDLLDGGAGPVADEHSGQHGAEQRTDAGARAVPPPAAPR